MKIKVHYACWGSPLSYFIKLKKKKPNKKPLAAQKGRNFFSRSHTGLTLSCYTYLNIALVCLSLISFTISLAGTERELIDLQFPNCLLIIKKIIIVLSMPGALPL